MNKKIIHLLANAHLDPVWLWDWREGLNEGIATCRSILKLMDKNPELTFMRGEASIYEHLERFDPESFARIKEYVKAGRWEIVGGNYVQTDTNLPDEKVFLKQYEYGRKYFKEKFDVDVNIAWAPDSFGHGAGLPDIYQASGLKYFAFTRRVSDFPAIEKPVFRWKGCNGGSVITLFDIINTCYCTNKRDEILTLLDGTLQKAATIPMQNIAFFYGLGNHGGGTSQRMLDDIYSWREKHPEVEVRFSTLRDFFAACEAEGGELPEYQGEINFCLRGCTSSAAKVKSRFRATESAILRAENVTRSVAEKLGTAAPDMTELWKSVLFNTFHDILPGSSIERANQEQMQWMDHVIHTCRTLEFHALNDLSLSFPVQVSEPEYDMPQAVPLMVYNPRPTAYSGPVEFECCLDYRPCWEYMNRCDEIPVELLDENAEPVPFQVVATEHNAITFVPWRRRVVAQMDIPANGWRIVTLGHVKKPLLAKAPKSKVKAKSNSISNEYFTVEAICGETGIKITRKGKSVLAAKGIEFATFRDVWGSWGAMDEDPAGFRCDKRLETWRINEVRAIEKGPERSSLFVVVSGASSQIRIRFDLYRGMDSISCSAQVIWQDRESRLRMVMDPADSVTYGIPGGEVVRNTCGDVPGGRWLKINGYGIASDNFCGFTALEDLYSVNLVRGCRSASDEPASDWKNSERPITDYGSHEYKFMITGPGKDVKEAAEELKLPLINMMLWTHQ